MAEKDLDNVASAYPINMVAELWSAMDRHHPRIHSEGLVITIGHTRTAVMDVCSTTRMIQPDDERPLQHRSSFRYDCGAIAARGSTSMQLRFATMTVILASTMLADGDSLSRGRIGWRQKDTTRSGRTLSLTVGWLCCAGKPFQCS